MNAVEVTSKFGDHLKYEGRLRCFFNVPNFCSCCICMMSDALTKYKHWSKIAFAVFSFHCDADYKKTVPERNISRPKVANEGQIPFK